MNQPGAARETRSAKAARAKQKFPAGWDEKKVQELIDHYNQLTDEDLAAEIEAAPAEGFTLMEVPTDLVPAIHKLLARHAKSGSRAAKRKT